MTSVSLNTEAFYVPLDDILPLFDDRRGFDTKKNQFTVCMDFDIFFMTSVSKLLIREHKKERWMIHTIIDQEASDGLGSP